MTKIYKKAMQKTVCSKVSLTCGPCVISKFSIKCLFIFILATMLVNKISSLDCSAFWWFIVLNQNFEGEGIDIAAAS